MRARKQIILFVILVVIATIAFVAFADFSIIAHPLTGYLICIISAVIMFAAGYLEAKATI